MFSVFDYPLKVHHWPPEWTACLEAWIQSLYDRSQSSRTVASYLSAIARFFDDGRMPWTYNKTDVQAFMHRAIDRTQSRGSTPSSGTMNHRLSVVASFYAFASGYWIERDGKSVPLFNQASPCRGIRYGKQKRKHPVVSDEDLAKLFAVIDVSTVRGARDMALLQFYLLTGRRRAEVVSLLWGDIEVRSDTVYYTFIGKGKRESPTRTTMPQACYESICHYLRLDGRLSTIEADDPIFVAAVTHGGGGLPIDPYRTMTDHGAYLRIKKYAQMAGIDPHISPHWLRHSNALARLQEGATLQEVSKALGHANVAVTALYIAELSGTEDEGANRLAQRFGKLFVAAPAQAMQPCEQNTHTVVQPPGSPDVSEPGYQHHEM